VSMLLCPTASGQVESDTEGDEEDADPHDRPVCWNKQDFPPMHSEGELDGISLASQFRKDNRLANAPAVSGYFRKATLPCPPIGLPRGGPRQCGHECPA
jgi:hypothetical protein